MGVGGLQMWLHFRRFETFLHCQFLTFRLHSHHSSCLCKYTTELSIRYGIFHSISTSTSTIQYGNGREAKRHSFRLAYALHSFSRKKTFHLSPEFGSLH